MEGHQAAAEKDTASLHRSPPTQQTNSAPFVLGVHVGPVVQQVLHHRHSVVTGGKMKRRGVSALQIPTVDVLRRAQRLRAQRERIPAGAD